MEGSISTPVRVEMNSAGVALSVYRFTMNALSSTT